MSKCDQQKSAGNTSNLQQCVKAATPPTQQEIADNMPNILAKLGIQSCKSATVGAADIWCGCAAVGKVDIGCEQISVISQKYLETTNIVTCILNSVSTTMSASAEAINNFKLKIGPTGKILCGNGKFEVNQQINLRFVDVSQVSTDIKTDIVNQITSLITETMKTFQTSKTEFLSSPDGQKAVNDALNSITKNMDNIINNCVVTDIINKSFAKNDIEIEIDGTVSGNSCIFNQYTLLDMAVQNLISTALTTMVSDTAFTKLKTDMENAQKSVAKGVGSLLSGIIAIIIFMMVGGLIFFGGGTIMTVLKYIVPIIIIIGLVVAVIFGIKKEYVVTGIASAAVVILIVFEFITIHKSEGNGSGNISKSKKG